MKIANSSIGMESARKYTSVSMEASRKAASAATGSFGFKGALYSMYDNKETSNSKTLKAITNKFETYRLENARNDRTEQDAITRIKAKCMQYLLMLLLGEWDKDLDSADETEGSGIFRLVNGGVGGTGAVQLNLVNDRISYHAEEEQTTFNSVGTVVTADGRELSFNVEMSMSRSFEELSMSRTATDIASVMCDPLVINLDTNVAEVSDMKFSFDLDGDGSEEMISRLAPGSGYLALDRNGDGTINDGTELFGTKSGDGFGDLAEYDSDGNGWIDENDEIFDRLSIYVQNDDGTQSLYKLADKNVGAIYLGSVNTDFSLNNVATNRTNAAIRRTGIFLYESGMAGTMQHVDLALEA